MHAILHMGPGKTGSTAIQNWLLTHHVALDEAGVMFCANAAGPGGNSGMVAAALIGPRGEETEDVGKKQFDIFKAEVIQSKNDTVIVSAEGFYNRLVYADHGLHADMALDSLRKHAQAVKTRLTDLGVTSITAVFVMRNEVDRTVSRVVQGFHGVQIDPDFDLLPPPNFEVSKPHDVLFQTLTDEGFDVQTVLYADPQDDRSLVLRVMETAGLADRITGLPTSSGRHNVSIGTLGCLASGVICSAINRHLPKSGDMNWRASGRSKGSLRLAYEELIDPKTDTPFNGLGPERSEEVQAAQALITARLGPWVTEREQAVLAQTKWLGVPMSPFRADKIAHSDRIRVAAILHRYLELVKQNDKTVEIISNAVLDDIEQTATELTAKVNA